MAGLANQARHSLGQAKGFIKTDTARNILHGGTVALASAVGGAYLLGHSWFAYKYQEIVQFYEHGLPVKVSEDLIALKDQVVRDLKVKKKHVMGTQLFHVPVFEPILIGSFQTTDGARLGLPKFFEYKTTGDVDRSDIMIEHQPVKWYTQQGSEFSSSLVLSDSAKKFAIAQQLSVAQSNYVLTNACLTTTGIVGYNFLTRYINAKTHGFLRPASYRLFIYGLSGTFMYGLWSVAWDLYNNHLERRGDEKAAGISFEYAKGGMEYYSKLLQRNMALRDLMGSSGESMYTALGNQNQFLRQKQIPISVRKDYLEAIILRDYEGKTSPTDETIDNNNNENIESDNDTSTTQ